MFNFNSILSFIFFIGFASSDRSQSFYKNSSISIENRDIIFNYRLENICDSYMNTNYKVNNSWQCSLLNNLPFDNKLIKILDPANKKYQIDCICFISYECYDYEEFVLDTELVNAKDYMSKEYFLGKNIYTRQCENGLEQLTDETNWNCVLGYDRFHEDEYYCNCKRPSICRIEKKLLI